MNINTDPNNSRFFLLDGRRESRLYDVTIFSGMLTLKNLQNNRILKRNKPISDIIVNSNGINDFASQIDFENAIQDVVYNIQESTTSTNLIVEVLTVTSTNNLSDLSNTPTSTDSVIVNINGNSVDTLPGSGITRSGRTLTVDPNILGYDILITHRVTVGYI